ncbi:MAG: DUF2835 domain-containing protein [Desulfomonilia bacterium]
MDESRFTRFSLRITADLFLDYYRGSKRDVIVKAHDGKTVRFPASILRGFVDADGIQGTFEIEYDASNRFRGIRRLE